MTRLKKGMPHSTRQTSTNESKTNLYKREQSHETKALCEWNTTCGNRLVREQHTRVQGGGFRARSNAVQSPYCQQLVKQDVMNHDIGRKFRETLKTGGIDSRMAKIKRIKKQWCENR